MGWGGFCLRNALHLDVLFAPGAFRAYRRLTFPYPFTEEFPVIRPESSKNSRRPGGNARGFSALWT
jgi:hypothetical protein